MVNELGLTKADIERWTKEAVRNQVKRHMETCDFKDLIRRQTKDAVSDEVRRNDVSTIISRKILSEHEIVLKKKNRL